MNSGKLNAPWVLLRINNVIYSVSCNVVLSLSQLPFITPLPKSPTEIRGVMDFRGKSIQVLDSRIMLGSPPISADIEDFYMLMEQRYNDHLNWINTLEKTVNEGTDFTLTTDPHKCAFGKWYDSYNPKNTNIMFLTTFAKFDAPHKAIHQIAIKAQEMIHKGCKKEALEYISSVKNSELKQMLSLFDDLKIAYNDSNKEIAVVLGDNSKCVALSVDYIVAIENLTDIDENLISDSITNIQYLSGIAKRKDGSVAFLLNDEYILKQFH